MVRFLTTGMMPASFEEHVCLEMALGEGLVLMALYGVIDTIAHDGIRQILQRAVKQEERHVDFGERRTMAAIRSRPALRRRLLGLSLVSLWGVGRLGAFMRKRLPADHAVLARLPEFLDFTVACAEKRLLRIGVLTQPLSEISARSKTSAIAEAYGVSAISAPLRLWPRKRLTDTYLRDPALRHDQPPEDEEPIRLVR
jgi:hypothetical protein